MFDYRIILIIVAALILICMITGDTGSGSSKQGYDIDTIPTFNSARTDGSFKIDKSKEIVITDEAFEKMVDILIDHCMKVQSKEEKYIMIFKVTLIMFTVNFPPEKLEYLDRKLHSYNYVPHNIQHAKGDKYENLQKSIITNMTYNLYRSERDLVHDKRKDRSVLHTYLTELLKNIRVKEV